VEREGAPSGWMVETSVWEKVDTSLHTPTMFHLEYLKGIGGATSQNVGCPSLECVTSQEVHTLFLRT
jgi:hypothetical protein